MYSMYPSFLFGFDLTSTTFPRLGRNARWNPGGNMGSHPACLPIGYGAKTLEEIQRA